MEHTLRRARLLAGLGRQDLAYKTIGVTARHIAKLEQGRKIRSELPLQLRRIGVPREIAIAVCYGSATDYEVQVAAKHMRGDD